MDVRETLRHFQEYTTNLPHLSLANLETLQCLGKNKVKIIKRCSAYYVSIGHDLLSDTDGSIVKGLQNSFHESETILCEIFGQWLRHDVAHSWEKLIECLKRCELNTIASEIEEALGIQAKSTQDKTLAQGATESATTDRVTDPLRKATYDAPTGPGRVKPQQTPTLDFSSISSSPLQPGPMDFSKICTNPLQSSLNRRNIVIKENYGLNQRTGFWWLVFTFDHEQEKAIEVRLTNFKYNSAGSVWSLEVVKCSYLGIHSKEDMASFDMIDELVNAKELARLQQCSVSNEKLRQYLETNVVPLVLKKIKYTRFLPQFRFFLSHQSRDKPAMRTFESGLKFLGYSTWIDEANMPMGTSLQAALKTSIEHCDCFVAWLNPDYFQSEYCRAELLYARQLGKIILPFGIYSEIERNLTGDLEFLRHLFISNPESTSFFEVLRRIDETLFAFEKMTIS